MLDRVEDLVHNLVLLLFVVVFLEMLMPRGQFNRYLRMVAGLLVILMILTFAGTLLGRVPAEKSLVVLAEQNDFAPEIRGTELWHLNHRQALQLYQDNLADFVSQIIAESGMGGVSSVRMEIESSENSPSYGAVLALEVVVERKPVPLEKEQNEPVLVPPVDIGPFKKETGAEQDPGKNEAERIPDLEKMLSDRLQLPLSRIVVRERS